VAQKTVYATSSDGDILNSDDDYATARGAGSGTNIADTNTSILNRNRYVPSSPYYRICRSFLLFEPGLQPGDTVTAVELHIYGEPGNQSEDDAGHSDLCLYEGNQHDPLILEDYDAFDTTLLTSGGYSWAYPLATDDYNMATLNAAGIALVEANKTGTVKFCIRTKGDVDDSTPTGNNRAAYYASEQGAGYQPKLVITYTPAAAGAARSHGYIMG
jgi:hypothetical protein